MKSRIFFTLAVLALGFGVVAPSIAFAQGPDLEASLKEALALFRAGKLVEAEEPLNRLLAATNNTHIPHNEILFYRAYLRSMNCRFQDAASDMKDVLDANPSNHLAWFMLTPLLIEAGETEEYQSHSKAMLRRFGDTTNRIVMERTAKSCLLVPSSVNKYDLGEAAKLAEKALTVSTNGEKMPWRLMTKGLSEYRLGHFDRAIETEKIAQKDAIQSHFGWLEPCQADAYFISAMAHQQLHQPTEARADFGHGRILVMTKMPAVDSGNLGGAWVDVLITRILMEEAQKVVQGAAQK